MAYIEEANELMTDATGQSIATAIGNMSATSVGNLAALQTTDKTSLVGAVNELKSGLTSVTDVDITEITLETGISWGTSKSSNMKKRCGQLYGNLYFNGLLDMTTSPYKKIGVISSQYRPLADSRMPVYLQTDSDIVIGVLAVFVTGSIFIIAPKGNYGKGDGIDANSWCTSDGVYINMLV